MGGHLVVKVSESKIKMHLEQNERVSLSDFDQSNV
jgi:hypothetical protein